MELMDRGIIAAVEEAYQFGFPLDAGAIAVIEIDGPAVGLDFQQERVLEFCRKHNAREVLYARNAQNANCCGNAAKWRWGRSVV